MLSRQPGQFLFVVHEHGSHHDRSVSGKKQSFIKTNYHKSQRDRQLKKLKASMQSLPNSKSPLRLVGSSLDPFSSLPLEMTDDISLYFHYYKDHCSRSVYPFSSSQMAMWWWQQAIHHSHLLNIILTASANHRWQWATVVDDSKSIQKSAKDAIRFRGKALQGVQQRLESPTDSLTESTVLAVAHLVCLEAADGNITAADAHIAGLQEIVHLMGGVDSLGYLATSTIYCGVKMRGACSDSKPAFPMSQSWKNHVYAESGASQLDRAIVRASPIGTRFFDFSSIWPEKMTRTLRLFRQCVIYVETSPTFVPLDHDFLLVMMHELNLISSQGHLETVRLSLHAFAITQIWTLQKMPCSGSLAYRLLHSLDSTMEYLQESAPELLFWVLFIGGLLSEGTSGHSSFVARLADSAEYLGIDSWDSALSLLKGFFLISHQEDWAPRALWDLVMRERGLLG